MTAIFSHESMDGFLFWNFWDGATWQNPGANMYRLDWSRTPAGDAFVDLVFNEWWTDVLKTTDDSGDLKVRGFKGRYNITYVCDGETITEEVDLTEDRSITIVCNDLQTNVLDITPSAKLAFKVAPNPASEVLRIERSEVGTVNAVLYNALGARVLETSISGQIAQIPVQNLKGIYFLELRDESGRGYQKVVIE